MADERRMSILRKLVEQYPEFVMKRSLQQSTSLLERDLERQVRYLEEKGLIDVRWSAGGFAAKINASGIAYIGEEIIDRKTLKTILKHLEEKYPDYVRSETFLELLNMNEDQLRRPFKYLEETGLVEIRWFLGKKFMIKITSHGIDQLENL